MSGYYGYSMSNNAVMAYEDGEMPLSKWTKTAIIAAIQTAIKGGEITVKCNTEKLKKLSVKVLKDELLIRTSWHHTSSHYNRTDFYSVDLDRLEELTDENIEQMSQKKSEKPTEPTEEKWKCSFLEWSGTRKHPKATECVEVGIVKGEWFIRANGSKKKTSANGFKFIEKVEN